MAGARTTPPGVVIALLALLGIVGGALVVAAIPGGARSLASPSAPAALVTQTPRPTPSPTPRPTATPSRTPVPTPSLSPAPTAVPAGEVADLCEIFFDIPCGLGPGTYEPSRFRPRLRVELGEGWSNAAHRQDVVALTRDEGTMTFAGKLTEAYPNGRTIEPRARSRDILEAFIATNGVGATDPTDVKIGGRKGLSTDLAPTGNDRVALFATDGSTFNLEPDRTTRIVVIDIKGGGTALIAIEPKDGFQLADILATADAVAASVDWRSGD